MHTEAHRYDGPQAQLTFAIIGCAMEVLHGLGAGLLEKPYENALAVELGRRGWRYRQQQRFEVIDNSVPVGEYVPDLIVDDAVIVDAKVIDQIADVERAQMLNHLKISQHQVGLVLNFRRPKLEWERIVL